MTILKAGRPIYKEKDLGQLKDIRDPIIRMNINMKQTFYKQIKQTALDENITITKIVCKALYEYINK